MWDLCRRISIIFLILIVFNIIDRTEKVDQVSPVMKTITSNDIEKFRPIENDDPKDGIWVRLMRVAVRVFRFLYEDGSQDRGGTEEQDDGEKVARVTGTPTPLPEQRSPTVPAQPTTMISPIDGVTIVYIPAGKFLMGSSENNPVAFHDESPQHIVYLDAFWMDQIEVTNARYEACVSAGACTLPEAYQSPFMASGPSHPVLQVNWNNAYDYCKWAGRRLPTEAEWEKAARGGLEGMDFPWGFEKPECNPYLPNGAVYFACPGASKPVKTFQPNGYGIYDMAGNAWEWVMDWYQEDYYSISPDQNPNGPVSGNKRVLRGGGWDLDPTWLRVAYRFGWDPDRSRNSTGIRCALDTP